MKWYFQALHTLVVLNRTGHVLCGLKTQDINLRGKFNIYNVGMHVSSGIWKGLFMKLHES